METIKFLFQQIGKIFKWWVIINPWELGIRVRLGKHTKLLQPGVHLKIPGIDKAYAQNTRLEAVDVPNQTLTTSDGKVLTISVVVCFRIVDIERLYTKIQRVDNTIIGVSMGKVASSVVGLTAVECKPGVVEHAVRDGLNALAPEWGLEFDTVSVNTFAYVKTLRLIGETSRSLWPEISLDVER